MLPAHYLKLKEGPVLQVKYETWIGFGLQKPNTNDDSFAPFKP